MTTTNKPVESFVNPGVDGSTVATSSARLFADVYSGPTSGVTGRMLGDTTPRPTTPSVVTGNELTVTPIKGLTGEAGTLSHLRGAPPILDGPRARTPDRPDTGRDRTTPKDTRADRVKGLDSPTGMPDTTSSNIAGLGRVEFKAERSSQHPNKIEKLNIALGDTPAGRGENLTLSRDQKSGEWKVEGGSKENQARVLKALGIEADANGKFKGELEIAKQGHVRYQDKDGPLRKVSYLGPDGQRTQYDHGTYTRTRMDSAGKTTAREGWDGHRYAKVDSVQTKDMPDGSRKTTLKFAEQPGMRNIKVERTAKVDATTGEVTDKAAFTRHDSKATGKEGRAFEYDWSKRSRTQVKAEGGKPVVGKTEFHDGTRYRAGTTGTDGSVRFTPDSTSGDISSVSRTRDGGRVLRGDKLEITRDKDNRTTRFKSGAADFELGRDNHGDINRIKLPDGRSFVRNGRENMPGLDYRLARGDANLSDLTPKDGKFNKWTEVGKDGKPTGRTAEFNFGIDAKGTARTVRPGDKPGDPPKVQDINPPKEARPESAADGKVTPKDLADLAKKYKVDPKLLEKAYERAQKSPELKNAFTKQNLEKLLETAAKLRLDLGDSRGVGMNSKPGEVMGKLIPELLANPETALGKLKAQMKQGLEDTYKKNPMVPASAKEGAMRALDKKFDFLDRFTKPFVTELSKSLRRR